MKFPLISDVDGAICTGLGVLPDPEKNAKRTTFIIDRSGTIRSVFENVVVDGHADEVLTTLRALD